MPVRREAGGRPVCVRSRVAAVASSRERGRAPLTDSLARLPVVPPIDNGYAFATFAVPPVARTDARGCSKDERVLLASATVKPRVGAGCRLTGGTWSVDQGRRTVRGARNVEVVPLVSAKTAWNQGAYGWSNTQRRSFLRWYQQAPRECAVGGGGRSWTGCGYVLQSSARLTAQITDLTTQPEWRPSCSESAAVVSILASWGLSAAPEAHAAMESGAPRCGTKVSITRKNRINPVPPTEAGNPFLAPGTDARVWTSDQVLDAPAGPAVPSSLFGLHVPEVTGPRPQLAYDWLRLWDSKTGWEPLEQNRGVYYWQWIDDAVAQAEAQGKKVMYVFGDTPPWAGPSPAYPPADISEFRRYAQAIIGRYGDRIDAYEVWNEPNLFVKESAELANLVEMTQIVHDTVKGAGLAALVLAPSTTMRTGTVAYPFFSEYLLPLGERGWPIDGFAFHTYPRAGDGPQERAQFIALFKEMLALAKAPALPIWDTEVNYGLGGLQEAKRDITGADAQGYLAQSFIDAVRYGVTQVDWYLWFPRFYALLGIQTNPGTPDTIRAWAWTHEQLVGASLLTCARDGAAIVCGFATGGASYALAYSQTGQQVDVDVPTSLTTACDMDGQCRSIADHRVTVGIRPLHLR